MFKDGVKIGETPEPVGDFTVPIPVNAMAAPGSNAGRLRSLSRRPDHIRA